jgi:hypothetical protein
MSAAGMSLVEANNFLALEPHLVAAVKAVVAGISPAVHVLTAADLGDVKESAQRTPAVHLIYGGYRVAEDLATAWRLEHTWYAVVVVKHVGAQRTGEAARAAAGPLLAQVVGALAGSSLPGATRPLALTTPPRAEYRAGVQYLPSAFMAETIFRKPLSQP